ncbi:MAG: sulfotransferase [bacterium]
MSGISRSGTSLLSVLINHIDNAVCFNEVLPSEAALLSDALAQARLDLLAGNPVRNKYDDKGQLTTDTLSGMSKKKRLVRRPVDGEVCVASKRNIPYLSQAGELLALGYRMVVMIRDPVYTLGSWSSAKAAEGRIPGALLEVGATHPHWRPVHFTRTDVIERRAEAWQHFAALIWSLRSRVMIIQYEELCFHPEGVVADLCAFAGLSPPARLPDVVLGPLNDDRRYPELSRIRAAVAELCPVRRSFGYE